MNNFFEKKNDDYVKSNIFKTARDNNGVLMNPKQFFFPL